MGLGQWWMSSPILPTLYVISVGHERHQFESGNFTIYVEKATEFSPGLRFSVRCR